MSCRPARNIAIVTLLVYLLLFQKGPLLPDSVRLPLLESLEKFQNAVLKTVDPLLKTVGLDRESRTGEAYPEEVKFSDVPELKNDAELEEALSKHEFLLLMAHAPWCGHCKNMHGAYASTYETIKDDFINFPNNKIGVYKYNGADKCDDPNTCKIMALNQHIQGFPTLLWLSGSLKKLDVSTYKGKRASKDLYDYAIDLVREPITSNDLSQIKTYLGQFKSGILHYVPPHLNADDARKLGRGFTMRQQIFTRSFKVAEDFAKYRVDLKSDKHVMLAFNGENFIGEVPQDSPASLDLIMHMYSTQAVGRLDDPDYVSNLPQNILLTVIRSKEFGRSIVEDYLRHGLVSKNVIGQIAIVTLDESQANDVRIANIFGISRGTQDCMILFNQATGKRHGICVKNIAKWISHEEFAQYWLDAMQGKKPETNNVNFKTIPDDWSQKESFSTVLHKNSVAEFIKSNDKSLIFVTSYAMHQDKNLKKFESLPKMDNVALGTFDLTLDRTVDIENGFFKVNSTEKETVLLYSNNKFVATLDGEITPENIKNLVEQKQVPSQSDL